MGLPEAEAPMGPLRSPDAERGRSELGFVLFLGRLQESAEVLAEAAGVEDRRVG